MSIGKFNSNMYHDTHAHLDILLEKQNLITLEKIDELLINHSFVIHSTVSTTNFHLVKELFQNNPKVKYLFGSHPEIVVAGFDLEEYLKTQKLYLGSNPDLGLVGIGEIGLDYHYTQDKYLHKIQQQLFESQIELALRFNLPVAIHCREAFEDTFAVLRNYPQIHGKFEIHCFTGGIDEAKVTLELGGKLGIGGIITFNNANSIKEAVSFAPIDSLLLETDLPFLSPIPKRGQICLPEYIDFVADFVAGLKGVSKEQIWNMCEANARDLYFNSNSN